MSEPFSTAHLEHLATRVIHLVGLGARMEKRMVELADVLLSISTNLTTVECSTVGTAGAKVSFLVQELKETSLVLNDDFRETIERETEISKRNLLLIIENENLKMQIAQLLEKVKETK